MNSLTSLYFRSWIYSFLFLILPFTGYSQVNVGDSLALVQMYQQTAGDDWLDNSNWLAGTVDSWFGISVDPFSQRVIDIVLPNNNLQGSIPNDILNLNNLIGINIAGNEIEDIPDFSLIPSIQDMEVSDNKLTFEDLEPINFGVFNFLNYSPQKPVGIAYDTIAEVGTSFDLEVPVPGTANEYFWFKDGQFLIQPPPSANGVLNLNPVLCTDQGFYELAVGSQIVPDLFIQSQPILVNTVGIDSLGAPYRCNQIIVQWDPSATDMEKDTMRSFFNADYRDSVLCGDIELWGLPDTVFLSSGDTLLTIEEIVSKTKDKSKIEEVDLNYLSDIEEIISFNQSKNFKKEPIFNPFSPPFSMDTVLAAIIDTGVDVDHSEIMPYLWLNTDEISNLSDSDGNCITDDINGYDFVDKETSVDDRNSHGSHVGGLMLEGLDPLADDVDLIILQTHDEFGGGDIFRIISGIYYATSKGAEVINISSGYSGGIAEILGNAIRDARDTNGTIVVCSAGNQGINNDTLTHYPSSFQLDNIISVAALNGAEDSIALFSNYGQTSVDLFAPGSAILSAIPGNELGLKSGTSMSSAIVSNAVILMKQASPISSYQEILSCLYSTATQVSDLDTLAVTGAKLNLTDAILCISTILNVEFLEFNAKRLADQSVQLDWKVESNDLPESFTIQRMVHGSGQFHSIGTAEVKPLQNHFEFKDPDVRFNTLYYRLRWEETDGEIQFSEIKSVEGIRDEALISLYPNPSTGQIFLEWPSLKKDTQVTLNVFDVLGQSVWTGQTQLQAGGQNPLNFDHLTNGLYQLQIELDGNFYSIPFIMMDR